MAVGIIKVTCGANSEEYGNIEGKTVGEVRKTLRDILNIPDGARALVQGEEVDDSYVLEVGDSLEFVKPAGQKG